MRKSNNRDAELLSALIDLQQAQILLITVGAQIKPERFL
jgi:hypothetical protein